MNRSKGKHRSKKKMALLYPTRRQMAHTGPTLNFDELSFVLGLG